MERATAKPALIDTDILIDASRGVELAGRFLNDRQQGPGLIVSVVSAMELIAGCRNAGQLAGVRQFLTQCEVLPLNEAISERARKAMESYVLSHGILLPDALIAATALEAGIPIFTRNTRHFTMISDLEVTQPY